MFIYNRPVPLTYTYTMNDSCFHPLFFLSPYLPKILSVLEWWEGLPKEGVTYFNTFDVILITLVSRPIAENFVEIRS